MLADDYVEKELPLLRYGTQQAHLSSLNRWIRCPFLDASDLG